MKLVENAGKIATRSYSMWSGYLGLGFLVWSEIRFSYWGADSDPAVMWWIGIFLIAFGLAGRLIDQGITSKIQSSPIMLRLVWALLGGALVYVATSGVLSVPENVVPKERGEFSVIEDSPDDFQQIAFSLIAKWEGKRNTSYLDPVNVWTICYGHTRTAGPDQFKTDDQCKALLIEEIEEYRDGIHRYFSDETVDMRLPVKRDVAFTSFAFNVGIQGAGRSTATRRLNAGDIAGGCEALTWWNKAGGRVLRGLVRRRSEERDYCLTDL